MTQPFQGLFGAPKAQPYQGLFGTPKDQPFHSSFGRPEHIEDGVAASKSLPDDISTSDKAGSSFGFGTVSKPLSDGISPSDEPRSSFGSSTVSKPLSKAISLADKARSSFGFGGVSKPSSDDISPSDKSGSSFGFGTVSRSSSQGLFGAPKAQPYQGLFGTPKDQPFHSSFGRPEHEDDVAVSKPSSDDISTSDAARSSFGFGTVSKSSSQGLFGAAKAQPFHSSFGRPQHMEDGVAVSKPSSDDISPSDKARSSFGFGTVSKPPENNIFGNPPLVLAAPTPTYASSLNGPFTVKPPPGAWPGSGMFSDAYYDGPSTVKPHGSWLGSSIFGGPPLSHIATNASFIDSVFTGKPPPVAWSGSNTLPVSAEATPIGYTEGDGLFGKRYILIDPKHLQNGFYVYDNGDTLDKKSDGSITREYHEGFIIKTDPEGNSVKYSSFLTTPISEEHIPKMVGFPKQKWTLNDV
jgi:hypothetical protein